MMNKEFLRRYKSLQKLEGIRALAAAITVTTGMLYATQTVSGGVAALTGIVGLFVSFGEFETDKEMRYQHAGKEELEYLKPILNKSQTLFKLFSVLTILTTPLSLLPYLSGSYTGASILSTIGLALSVFGLNMSFNSIRLIQPRFDEEEAKEKFASLVNPEIQAIDDLKKKCAKYPNLLKKMDSLTSCTHNYPRNPWNRTISDTYAACQQGRPDTLVTLQWVHKKLEKVAKAKGNNKNRIAKKLEKKLASPQYIDKFIR
jgi:hypothetical protein